MKKAIPEICASEHCEFGPVPFAAFIPKPADRLRGLPGLLVADVGIAHGRADTLVAEELLDFPQSFPTLLSRTICAWLQPVGRDLPHPERSAGRP